MVTAVFGDEANPMRTLLRLLGLSKDQTRPRRTGSPPRIPLAKRRRARIEILETRSLCSVGGHELFGSSDAHHHVLIRTLAAETNQTPNLGEAVPSLEIPSARKTRSFTIAQENKFLPGKWDVIYDASSLFGPGAIGAQEIVFTGPKGAKTFSSISAVSVPGYFGRSYYQFYSAGTYQFLSKNLVRLTITSASPTEYLGNPILVMSGESMPIQFQNSNQFIVQGQVYNREPLNQTIFNN
jgi:hypothetical protein